MSLSKERLVSIHTRTAGAEMRSFKALLSSTSGPRGDDLGLVVLTCADVAAGRREEGKGGEPGSAGREGAGGRAHALRLIILGCEDLAICLPGICFLGCELQDALG